MSIIVRYNLDLYSNVYKTINKIVCRRTTNNNSEK